MSDKQILLRIDLIRKSGLFDENEYPFTSFAVLSKQDPVLHYLTFGEPRGAKPSNKFDPFYYSRKYDIKGDSPLLHYILVGQNRGWDPLPLACRYRYEVKGFRPGFKRVALLLHDATLSGAPVLGWNIVQHLMAKADVIALLARGGSIQDAFLDIAAATVLPSSVMRHPFTWAPIDVNMLAGEIMERFAPHSVLCNSIDNAPLVKAFAKLLIPCVTLVHEFSETYQPGQLMDGFAYSSHIVFPAKIVRDSAFRSYPALASRRVTIMPQGQSIIPSEAVGDLPRRNFNAANEPFIVMGCGNIEVRKGIDIFIATAASLQRLKPQQQVKFVWIGADQTHHSYELKLLNHQIRESGLTGIVELVAPTPNFKQHLSRSSVFFLSSRLDPLPNVAIDAMMEGKPVICFQGASGLPEYLASDPLLKTCAVPYLDSTAAATAIARMIDDRRFLADVGQRAQQQAERTFRMGDYVARLFHLLRASENNLGPLHNMKSKDDTGAHEDDLILRALDTGSFPRFGI